MWYRGMPGTSPYRVEMIDLAPNDRQPFLMEAPGALERYEPLIEPELFLRFAELSDEFMPGPDGKINLTSASMWDRVAAFAGSHGWLGLRDWHGVDEYLYTPYAPGEPLSEWYGQVNAVVAVLDVLEQLRMLEAPDGGARAKQRLLNLSREPGRTAYWRDKSGLDRPTVGRRQSSADIVECARRFVARCVSRNLLRFPVTAQLHVDDKGRLMPFDRPCNLISAIWLQTRRYAMGNTRVTRCAICNRRMDVSENYRHKTTHKHCSHARSMQEWRAREKAKQEARRLAGEGRSVNEIAERLGGDRKTIAGWLKKGSGNGKTRKR